MRVLAVSPKLWKMGRLARTLSCCSRYQTLRICSTCPTSMRLLSETPLGSPAEPEVKSRAASSSGFCRSAPERRQSSPAGAKRAKPTQYASLPAPIPLIVRSRCSRLSSAGQGKFGSLSMKARAVMKCRMPLCFTMLRKAASEEV